LALFFAAMPLKYILGDPVLVPSTGMAHGLAFIAYILVMIPVLVSNRAQPADGCGPRSPPSCPWAPSSRTAISGVRSGAGAPWDSTDFGERSDRRPGLASRCFSTNLCAFHPGC